MIEAIAKILASAVGYFAAKGIDAIIGKWVAYVTIAFETQASDKARAAFNETMAILKKNLAEKGKAWESWRDKKSTPNT
jgi:hypothetical protein